jgi:hypothetical protein
MKRDQTRMEHPVLRPLLGALDSPWFVPAAFVLYLGLRLSLLLCVPIAQHSDEAWYVGRAIDIAAGRGYSEGGIPTAYWPVGWPGFLGLVFWVSHPSPFVGQLVNLACSVAIFGLTLRLGARLFGEPRVGRLAVLMLALYPNQIAYVPILGTEMFYAALVLLAVDLLVGGGIGRGMAAGLVFGVASLTKAQTVLLPAFVFALWWLAAQPRPALGRSLARAGLVYLAMAAVILPWTARNYRELHAFVPISTNGGPTLLGGNNPSANGGDAENDPLMRRLPHAVADQVAADREARALAFAWIREHPVQWLVSLPKKIWWLWAPDGEGEWAYEAGYPRYDTYRLLFRAVRILNQAYYAGLLVLFLISIRLWAGDRQHLPAEFTTGYALVLFTTVISLIFSGQSRFHFAVMPWIAMYAAWSLLRPHSAAVQPALGAASR